MKPAYKPKSHFNTEVTVDIVDEYEIESDFPELNACYMKWYYYIEPQNYYLLQCNYIRSKDSLLWILYL